MREKLNFNAGWRFQLGDEELPVPPLKGVVYSEAKTERCLRGRASYSYGNNREMEFERWEAVTLPHDFIISQEPKSENNETLGYFKYDNAWYRKKFRVENGDMGKRLVLYFEGVATHATVYVNGCLMAHNFCGYTSFEVDITDIVRYDADNVVSVYVNTTEKHEGWWYSGGGIYRPVWLIKTDLVSVDLYGAYVHPEKTENGWNVPMSVTVRNDDAVERTVRVTADISEYISDVAPNAGEVTPVIATAEGSVTVGAKDMADAALSAFVADPKLWSCDHPNLYNMTVHIYDGENEIDTYKTFFGFRTLRFDPDHGFFLNGENVKIKGVCCHEDYGLQGKAVSDSVKRLRLERLREMGANGYRTSHYQQSDSSLRYMAELGYLVMAETRWFESTKEGLEQLATLMKCQRNNPAVIMWSFGNEEPFHNNFIGKRIFVTMREHARRLDNSRPFTSAVSNNPAGAPVMDEVDIIGINYNLKHYDSLHEKFPNKMIFASECCAVGSTRGWVLDDSPKRGYLHCYDNRSGWFMSREVTWKFLAEREWIGGGYQWAGIEHRGETVWPRLCSQSGALDLFLQKKDAFYENKAHWTDEPMAHILPHWNLEGREGEDIWVWIYTNCDEIELFQDGVSLGRVAVEKYGHAEYHVIYRPGKLEAKGYRNGEYVCSDVVETTGKGVSLELELQNRHPLKKWDTAVFNCYVRDAEGRRVPDASPLVSFDCSDNAVIVGTGSDVCDHTPVPSLDRKMRAGIASACLKVNEGVLKVWVKADGLKGGYYTCELL